MFVKICSHTVSDARLPGNSHDNPSVECFESTAFGRVDVPRLSLALSLYLSVFGYKTTTLLLMSLL